MRLLVEALYFYVSCCYAFECLLASPLFWYEIQKKKPLGIHKRFFTEGNSCAQALFFLLFPLFSHSLTLTLFRKICSLISFSLSFSLVHPAVLPALSLSLSLPESHPPLSPLSPSSRSSYLDPPFTSH